MTDHEQPAAGVVIKPLMDQLAIEIADAAERSDATPLERFVAEALTSEDAKVKGLVERVWVVSLPDARKAIAAIMEWNTRALTDAGGAVSEAGDLALMTCFVNNRGTPEDWNAWCRIRAALTPAPQAEGEALPDHLKAGAAYWRGECDLAGLVERLEADPKGVRPRTGVAIIPADDLSALISATRSLAADRDKAVGLLRRLLDFDRTDAACVPTDAHCDLQEEADAFLSNQTEGS